MKRFTLKKKIVAAAAAGAMIAGVGGAAFAFFTTGGSGTGSGTTGTEANTTVAASFPVIADLGDIVTATTATIKNNSTTGSVSVAGKSLTLLSADCSGGVGAAQVGVPASWFSLGGTLTAPATTIAAGATVNFAGPVTLTLNDDLANNQDACQGATVTLHLGLA